MVRITNRPYEELFHQIIQRIAIITYTINLFPFVHQGHLHRIRIAFKVKRR